MQKKSNITKTFRRGLYTWEHKEQTTKNKQGK